jgi:hypothetical protein
MHVCYFDESGDTRALPEGNTDVTLPKVFAFAGVSFNARENGAINRELISLKSAFLGDSQLQHAHDHGHEVVPEVKGKDLRLAADGERREAAFTFIDGVFGLVKAHDTKLHGRVFIKVAGEESKGEEHYNRAVQLACTRFQERLDAIDHKGVVIIDNRHPHANEQVAHAIYLNKFRNEADHYPRIVDLPTFGQSQNHAGLQLADIMCELLVSTALTNFFGAEGARRELAVRYAPSLQELQSRYVDRPEKTIDGITVATLSGKLISPAELFAAPEVTA